MATTIPQAFIETLLSRIDIVDVIGRRLKLKKSGVNYFACCPFHSEKTPSFSVSPAKQFYYCFGCGAHGTAITFLMEYEGLSFTAAVEALASEAGLTVPHERAANPAEVARQKSRNEQLRHLLEKAAHFYQQMLTQSPKALDYLKARGLTESAIRHFGLGYAPDQWQALAAIFPHYQDPLLSEAGLVIDHEGGKRYDRFRDRIIFPIHDRHGQVIAFGGRVIGSGEPKYLNSPETPLFSKGHTLYGLALARDAIRSSHHAIVVEGYMDVVTLWQHGIANAVAVLGTAATAHHVRTLLALTDEVIFCFDGDAAGRQAAWRTCERSLEALKEGTTIRFAFLPLDEDPDSFVRRHGREAFTESLKTSQTLSQYLIDSLTKELPLETAEGRARLIHLAAPLLAKITAKQLRQQIEAELASRARLPVAQITASAISQSAPATPAPAARRQPATAPRPLVTLGTRMLRLLLTHPTLAAQVPAGLLEQTTDPDLLAAQRLIDAIDHGEIVPTLPLAAIISHFADQPAVVERLQAQAATLMDEAMTSDDPQTELRDLIHALTLHTLQQEIEELLAKSRTQALSPEEQQHLASLIRERQLRRQNRQFLA